LQKWDSYVIIRCQVELQSAGRTSKSICLLLKGLHGGLPANETDDDILPAAHGPPGQKGEKVRPANDNDDNNNNTSKNNKLILRKL